MMGNENLAGGLKLEPSATLQTGAMLSSPAENAPAWFVAQTKPNQERKAADHLREQGFDALLPVIERREYRRGRASRVVRELAWRSYLLVSFAQSFANCEAVLSTPGVASLLGKRRRQIVMAGRAIGNCDEPFLFPLPLPAPVMARMLSQLDAEQCFIDRKAPDASLPEDLKGKRLRVLSGPFTSFDGICQLSALERVTVLLNLFGRENPVELDRAQVELA